MTTPHPFNNIIITPSTLLNGAIGTYTTQITLDNDHFSGDKLTINFPSQLTLVLASVTTVTGTPSAVSVTATQTSNSAIITLTTIDASIPAGSNLILLISSLTNTGFTTSIGSFTFTSTDSANFQRSRSTITDATLITEPNLLPFPPTSVVPSTTIISQTSNTYTFTVARVNSVTVGGVAGRILVEFPSEIIAPTTPVCSNVGGIANIGCTTVGNIVTITGTTFDPVGNNLIFTISPITNPSVNVSGSFVISTTTSTGTVVDQRTTDLRFNADCDAPCKTCTANRTTCTSCFDDVSSILKFLDGTTCVSTCPSGSVDINNVCTPCVSPCAECSVFTTQCTKCQVATPQLYLSGTTCVDPCPNTFYKDDSSLECSPCSTNCVNCQNFDQCLSCPINKVLYNQKCFDSCPVDITVDMGGVCEACDARCQTCSITPTNCPTCKSPYIPYNNQCLDICPDTLYYNATLSTCMPCDSPCEKCTLSSTSCSSCLNNKFLYGTSCVDDCPTGFYKNITTRTCTECVGNCDICSSSTICTQCTSPYLLSSGSCVGNCPTGTVAVGQICTACTTGCSSCIGTTTFCDACQTGFKLTTSNTCSPTCPAGKYDTGTTCDNCHTTCSNCTGPGTSDCTACSNGPNPFLTPTGSCSNICPASYYGDTTLNRCMGCNGACTACFGATSTECTVCNSNHYLWGTSCLTQCPSNSIQQGSNCVACSSNCRTCLTTINNCASCYDGFNLTENASGGTFYCLVDPTYNNGTNNNGTHNPGLFESGAVPFPFLIGGLIFAVFVLGARAAVPETVVPGNLLAVLSFALFAATLTYTLLTLFTVNDFTIEFNLDYLPILLFCGGLITNYINNIAHLIIIRKLIKNDLSFRKWRENKTNRRVSNTILIFSTLTTFKVNRLVYNRLLGLNYFSADMKSSYSLRSIFILTILNIITSYLPFVAGSVYQLSKGFESDQVSITTIEVIILVVLCSTLCLCDISSSRTFYKTGVDKAGTEAPSMIGGSRLGRSKLGLLEDESKIDVIEHDDFMAGTDNLRTHLNETRTSQILNKTVLEKLGDVDTTGSKTKGRLRAEDLMSPVRPEAYSFREPTSKMKLLRGSLEEDDKKAESSEGKVKNVIFPKSKLQDYTVAQNLELRGDVEDQSLELDQSLERDTNYRQADQSPIQKKQVEGGISNRDYGEDLNEEHLNSSSRKLDQKKGQYKQPKEDYEENVFDSIKKEKNSNNPGRFNTDEYPSNNVAMLRQKRLRQGGSSKESGSKSQLNTLPDEEQLENIRGIQRDNSNNSMNKSNGNLFKLDEEDSNLRTSNDKNLSIKEDNKNDIKSGNPKNIKEESKKNVKDDKNQKDDSKKKANGDNKQNAKDDNKGTIQDLGEDDDREVFVNQGSRVKEANNSKDGSPIATIPSDSNNPLKNSSKVIKIEDSQGSLLPNQTTLSKEIDNSSKKVPGGFSRITEKDSTSSQLEQNNPTKEQINNLNIPLDSHYSDDTLGSIQPHPSNVHNSQNKVNDPSQNKVNESIHDKNSKDKKSDQANAKDSSQISQNDSTIENERTFKNQNARDPKTVNTMSENITHHPYDLASKNDLQSQFGGNTMNDNITYNPYDDPSRNDVDNPNVNNTQSDNITSHPYGPSIKNQSMIDPSYNTIQDPQNNTTNKSQKPYAPSTNNKFTIDASNNEDLDNKRNYQNYAPTSQSEFESSNVPKNRTLDSNNGNKTQDYRSTSPNKSLEQSRGNQSHTNPNQINNRSLNNSINNKSKNKANNNKNDNNSRKNSKDPNSRQLNSQNSSIQNKMPSKPNHNSSTDNVSLERKSIRNFEPINRNRTGSQTKDTGVNQNDYNTPSENMTYHPYDSMQDLTSHQSNGTFVDIKPFQSTLQRQRETTEQRSDQDPTFTENDQAQNPLIQNKTPKLHNNLIGENKTQKPFVPNLKNKNPANRSHGGLNDNKKSIQSNKIISDRYQTDGMMSDNSQNPHFEEEKAQSRLSRSQRNASVESSLQNLSQKGGTQTFGKNSGQNSNRKTKGDSKQRSISHRPGRRDKKDRSKMQDPKEREIEFSEDSQVSVSDLDNFVNEDTPSNYNMLNQRFDADARYTYTSSIGKYMREVPGNNNLSSMHPDSLQRRYLPHLNGQANMNDDRLSSPAKSTSIRNSRSTPMRNGLRSRSNMGNIKEQEYQEDEEEVITGSAYLNETGNKKPKRDELHLPQIKK